MNLTDLKKRKEELGYTNQDIADMSGLPLEKVQDLFDGNVTPDYNTYYTIVQCFDYPLADHVNEPLPAYLTARPGEYTIEDFFNAPPKLRLELIDGVFYAMNAPSTAHQLIVGFIHAKLLTHVHTKKGKCLPLIAPLSVQLNKDNTTMILPDLIIVCDRQKITPGLIFGAPDFIIEVLSKSTADYDKTTKFNKYKKAGVREYWMIDPDKRTVLVCHFEKGIPPVLYGFDAKVPIGIWAGECEIDFQEVYAHIRFLEEN